MGQGHSGRKRAKKRDCDTQFSVISTIAHHLPDPGTLQKNRNHPLSSPRRIYLWKFLALQMLLYLLIGKCSERQWKPELGDQVVIDEQKKMASLEGLSQLFDRGSAVVIVFLMTQKQVLS